MAATGMGQIDKDRKLSDLAMTGWVAACGGVGGLVYWLLQHAAGLDPFGWRWYAGLPTTALLGAFASVVGVYIVANSDTAELKHTLAFALICGLAWKPIINSATDSVTDAIHARQGDSAVSLAVELKQQAQTGTVQQVQAKATQTAETAAQLQTTLATARNEAVKTKLIHDSRQAVTALTDISAKDPRASIQGLTRIGQAAASNNQIAVSDSVVSSLQRIRKQNPALTQEADAAIAAIKETPHVGGR
jgi:hypothetical protein